MIEQTPAILLARVQFAFTISFHFLLPAFSIGLASYLAVLEALWLRTGSGVYANLFRYWLKIFAIVFAMGVVSGIVMSYQFGTNWAVFSDRAGPVIGPLTTGREHACTPVPTAQHVCRLLLDTTTKHALTHSRRQHTTQKEA